MNTEQILDHFTDIYHHNYKSLNEEFDHADPETELDTYEIKYLTLIFLGEVGQPVSQSIMDQAFAIYEEFKMLLILNELVESGQMGFKYNSKTHEYEYVPNPAIKLNSKQIKQHHNSLHTKLTKLAQKFQKLIQKASHDTLPPKGTISPPTTPRNYKSTPVFAPISPTLSTQTTTQSFATP